MSGSLVISCSAGRKHAALELSAGFLLSVDAGPCECGGDPAKCELPQITCVNCRCLETSRQLAGRELTTETVIPPSGRNKSATYVRMEWGLLGELHAIGRAAVAPENPGASLPSARSVPG